jgi:hypothetical protein
MKIMNVVFVVPTGLSNVFSRKQSTFPTGRFFGGISKKGAGLKGGGWR